MLLCATKKCEDLCVLLRALEPAGLLEQQSAHHSLELMLALEEAPRLPLHELLQSVVNVSTEVGELEKKRLVLRRHRFKTRWMASCSCSRSSRRRRRRIEDVGACLVERERVWAAAASEGVEAGEERAEVLLTVRRGRGYRSGLAEDSVGALGRDSERHVGARHCELTKSESRLVVATAGCSLVKGTSST